MTEPFSINFFSRLSGCKIERACMLRLSMDVSTFKTSDDDLFDYKSSNFLVKYHEECRKKIKL